MGSRQIDAVIPVRAFASLNLGVVIDRVATRVPGVGRYRFAATRDMEGPCAMVYVQVIQGPKVYAWGFNPRDGMAKAIGADEKTGEREFTPPDLGKMMDWVLVLDDAARNDPTPCNRSKN